MRNLSRSLLAMVAGLCFSLTALAQAEDDVHDRMRHIFAQVDPAYVPSNLLYDYGYNLADVTPYQGQAGTTAATDYLGWQALYASLYSMQFSTYTMQEPAVVHQRIMQSAIAVTETLGDNGVSSPVTMPVMDYAYQRFRTDALPGGYVEIINEQVVHKQGNPFTTAHAVAMVPRRNQLRGPSQTFVFVDSLYFTNTGTPLPALSVDLGDGSGYRTVSWNSPVHAWYGADGRKDIRLRMSHADGTLREAYTQVQISGVPALAKSAPATRYAGNPRDVEVFSFLEPEAVVTRVYANNDGVLRKPFIVVEGFDPWHLIAPDDPTQNYDVDDFIENQNNGGLARIINIDYEGQLLSDFLEENGYDIVFVDWVDGSDIYSPNMNILLQVIQAVNDDKAAAGSTEPNVMLGLSMGGIQGANAMLLAEEQDYDHQISLFINNDVPYQGANIPVAFQLGLKHVAGLKLKVGPVFGLLGKKLLVREMLPAIQTGMDVLNSYGANSLLRYQARNEGNTVALDADPIDLRGLEFTRQYPFVDPARTRMVALANGHECGDRQAFAAGTSLFQLSGTYSLPYLWNLLGTALTPLTNRPGLFVLGPVTTQNDLKWDIKLNALPDDGPARIYRNKVWMEKKILWTIPVSQALTDVNINSQAGMLPLDNAPGGTMGMSAVDEEVPEEVLELLPVTEFSFVPTVSALDVQEPDGSLPPQEALYLRYSGTAAMPTGLQTPMVNYITENVTNQPHLLLSQTKGRWLADELEGLNLGQPCAGRCGWRPEVSLPGTVCSGDEVTLSVNNPFGFPLTWIADERLELIAESGNTLTVRTPEGMTGVVYDINVRLNAGDCGTYRTPTAYLSVGDLDQQALSGELQGSRTLSLGSETTFYVSTVSNVESYEWLVPEGWQVQNLGWKANITPTTTGTARVMVKLRNGCNFATDYIDVCVSGNGYSCGGSSGPCGTVTDPCEGPGNPTERSVLPEFYPNPAGNVITVRFPPEAQQQPGRNLYRVRIRDNRMQTVLKQQNHERTSTLDVSDLPAGLYTIELWWKGGSVTEQLIIE
ncbi:T9SS type A sorting domain-containing protein [Roseivirga sp. BDSF3-8]|uniref:T9SS type A sorting domain-containing protein n=1 Tax=Roseivirga sp. BDSF3-8 TaxID=3241598 RepID=UPI0035325ADE